MAVYIYIIPSLKHFYLLCNQYLLILVCYQKRSNRIRAVSSFSLFIFGVAIKLNMTLLAPTDGWIALETIEFSKIFYDDGDDDSYYASTITYFPAKTERKTLGKTFNS